MSSNLSLIITLSVVAADLLVMVSLLLLRLTRTRANKQRLRTEALLLGQLAQGALDLGQIHPKQLLKLYNRLASSLVLPEDQEKQIQAYLASSKLISSLTKGLRSPFVLRRIEACVQLKRLANQQNVRQALLGALEQEKQQVVVLYLFEALSKAKERKAILIMLKHLRKATPWMAGRYRALLVSYGTMLLPYLKNRLKIDRSYFSLLVAQYAKSYPTEELKDFLIRQAQAKNILIRKAALEVLCLHYPTTLHTPPFLESPYRSTLPFVIRAYAQRQDKNLLPAMLKYAKRIDIREQLVQSISEMAYRDPSLIRVLLVLFEKKRSKSEAEVLAKILDNRLTYILESHQGPLDERITSLVTSLVSQNHISGLVQFLNTNQESEKHAELGKLIRTMAKRSKNLRLLLFAYLHPSVFKALDIPKPPTVQQAAKPHQEKPQRMMLTLLLLLTLLIFPLIILISELPNLVDLSLMELVKLYVVRFNYLLVFYSVTINCIYLAILGISLRGAAVQNRLWRAKDKQMLFTEGLLPSVSIIAPAYNEAANIIESTNSLLNQHYPDFELIVVNDGSKDDTLAKLINYFNLEKRDQLVPRRLKTRPLRGIYRNKNIPNLVVVDKVNGGKADSLNLGLNVAKCEFFCGIDADSLLESDALLRAVSVMLDHQVQSIASGGNICPVNGCDVELGSLDSIALPHKFLARLQSLEYIRSFMTGRIGWARMNLLLIISGAFGVFHRDRTIATGGYLTKSGKYHKDTVGEDMELVVRLSRYMRERHLPYRVQYASNANCWTEVPEKWKVLRRQRDRWHRGLIDILLFHSTMIGNPKYGRLGLVGLPYYFVFELIGPFVEAQGLLFVFIGFLLGLINLPIALALFTSTILLGILVSLASLFISEFDRALYSNKDMLRLIRMAIIENFGVRQVISLWRVSAYFSAMRKNRGWGAQVRTGFKVASAQTKTK
nr:glycosyltransferase [uncultured Sphaerochaeta sp.]